MATEQPENPPAFPRTGEGIGNPRYDEPGMTLRDWFAGQSITAVMTKITGGGSMNDAAAVIARASYAIADAMIAARKDHQ